MMSYLHSKKAKYKPPGDVNMKEFTDDNQATLVQSTSKSFMQSEEDLATFEPSEYVQTSGAMEHQGGQFVTCTMFTCHWNIHSCSFFIQWWIVWSQFQWQSFLLMYVTCTRTETRALNVNTRWDHFLVPVLVIISSSVIWTPQEDFLICFVFVSLAWAFKLYEHPFIPMYIFRYRLDKWGFWQDKWLLTLFFSVLLVYQQWPTSCLWCGQTIITRPKNKFANIFPCKYHMTDDHLLNSVADLFAISLCLVHCSTELSLRAGLIHIYLFVYKYKWAFSRSSALQCVKLNDAVKLHNRNKNIQFLCETATSAYHLVYQTVCLHAQISYY